MIVLRRLIEILLLGVLLTSENSQAEPLPAGLVVPIMLKLVSLEDNLSQQDEITIQVIGRDDVADIAKARVGYAVGNAKLGAVTMADGMPKTAPDVIFAAKLSDAALAQLVEYCRQHNVVLIGEQPELINKGLALVLFNDEGVPGVLLNLAKSKQHQLRWHPDVLNVVTVVD
ncbi:hypothetical protein C2869_02110 [Saccharobesus litoralis]|uniref:Uncharacterized protein n=1 Tax=Saccharobesus litoralis TaxID=2172099 RepID=A0A2S0VMI2_9ALTE|nr:YfiR family protein [Saccharobesus litoralis]AWB65310.1 hypothetical protein C2869_02110 [Saccharobesus litoralis]